MFTGIIEDVGVIEKTKEQDSNRTFQIFTNLKGIGIDDSIACNGICLTVENKQKQILTFTAVSETMQKTNAGQWQQGDRINLERTLKFNGRIDGHLVQGHVDGTGLCTSILSIGGSHEITFLFEKKFSPLIVEKGSICINGVSLTAFQVNDDTFKVAIIPYTWSNTDFQFLKENDIVNLEFDMVGKYIQRYLSLQQSQ
jgi:riboflavin synthase